MTLSIQECADSIISASSKVMTIKQVLDNQWYRKPKGPRKGPWFSCEYEVINQELWNKKEECIYFVSDNSNKLKYVGISVNALRDRWRTSLPMTNLKSLWGDMSCFIVNVGL